MVINDQHETTQDDGKPAIMRMKGGASQTLTEPVTMLPAADAGLELTGLDLVISTGSDNLDGGRDPQDNANVVIRLASGTQRVHTQRQQDPGMAEHL